LSDDGAGNAGKRQRARRQVATVHESIEIDAPVRATAGRAPVDEIRPE
jgi:hypothetical protein